MVKKAAAAAAAQDDNEEKAADTGGDTEREALFGALSKDELANLTDEERKGIEGDPAADEDGEADDADTADTADAGKKKPAAEEDEAEEDEDKNADKTKDKGDEEADDEDGEGEGEEEAGADKAKPTEEEAEAEAEAADEESDDGDDLDAGPAVPNWQMPENAEQKVKDLDQQATDLTAKFDEGDMTAGEFHAKIAEVNAAKADLTKQIDRAEMAFQMRHSHFVGVSVRQFLRDNPQYAPKNPIMYNMLDAEVRRLQVESDDPFDPRLLRQAHRNIKKAIGQEDDAAADKEKPATKDGKAKPAKLAGTKGAQPPKGEKPEIPKTLARVPSDEIDDASGGKFARLERLSNTNPAAFEAAVEKMRKTDPSAYEEYLASA